MLFNLAIIVILALLANWCCEKIKIPGLLGMILVGIIFGPYGIPSCNLISPLISEMSAELRTGALIIILIRAGLGLNRQTLNKVGIPALKMSCIPCLVEGGTVTLIAHYLLKLDWAASGMLGFIIAAVSPAVVVPQMLDIKAKGYGKEREVPTLILAGASIDDVFAITLFGVFLAAGIGETVNIATQFIMVPLGIITGILIGLLAGYLLVKFFAKFAMRDTKKMLIFLVVAISLHQLEYFKHFFPIAVLLSVMAMGFMLLELDSERAHNLAKKFNKLWVFAELLLFVLIGAQVNIKVAFDSGLWGIVIIAGGLCARSLGVWLALLGSKLTGNEKLFCVFSYIPKATVQAAIGAIPLSMGIEGGELILAIAVLSIIITAPLGASLIRSTHTRLLEHPE
ncbi:MAG: cation:proton antiporter [Victivallaceae bacterium]|nr:cation:proton antiporter [Victivallaceae bacterium]